MSIFFNSILACLAVLFSLIPLLLTMRLKYRLPTMLQCAPSNLPWPLASVILPCKGLDPGFRENILSLLQQDYPKLELLFVVATDDDPAFIPLQNLLEGNAAGRVRARLLVAGIGKNRAQKLTNQLAALRQVSPHTEVLVFVDSDCRPDPGFMRRLIAPLAKPGVGATTGYRWYHPPAATLGSMLRSTWNAGALPFLADPKTTHAWGGAMAIRREVFSQANLEEVWNKAVSDDLTLTMGVRKLGLTLEFVPQCIAVSYESSTLRETLEFTNRQSLISRIYFPPLWWATAIGHACANLLMAYGCASVLIWSATGAAAYLIGSTCLLLLPLQLVNAVWLFSTVKDLLPVQIQTDVQFLRWHYVMTAPLASVMTLVNTVHSAATRQITWRGITYELRSPSETIVVSRID